MSHRSIRGVAAVVAVAFFTTGCNTMYPRYLGIRPDSPSISPSREIQTRCTDMHPGGTRPLLNACEAYLSHVEWAQQLAESYRTRATMNEWSIYLGGTIALGALSAVAGLGLAAAAATTTIGLIGVSSGFASGFFALLDNKTRAGFYTVAANEIASALAEADTKAVGATTPQAYTAATGLLAEKVSAAAATLETKRYEAAAAAAAAAKTAESTARLEELARLAETATVVGVDPSSGPASEEQTVELKTQGIDLEKYKGQMSVLVDGDPVFSDVENNALKVKMPKRLDKKARDVVLRLRLGPLPVFGHATYSYTAE